VRPLRITFVAPFGLQQKGTTRARVVPLAAALAERGHWVRVVVPAWDSPEDCGREYTVGFATVLHVPARAQRLGEMSPVVLAATWRASLGPPAPDVIHCFKPIGYSGAVALAATTQAGRRWRSRVVAVDTDDLEGGEGWGRWRGRPSWQVALLDAQEGLVLRRADLVTVGSRLLGGMATRWGIPSTRIVYLPNAASAPWPEPQSVRSAGSLHLLLYTRFNEFDAKRGLRMLGAVMRRVPTALLTVVGDGPGRARFESCLRRQAWADRVQFTGFLEGDALARRIGQADLAIWLFDNDLRNRARSPVKLLELLAAGIPIVAEDVGEVGALARGAARLVRPDSPEQLASAVAAVIDEPGERWAVGARARAAANKNSWSKRAQQLEQHYLLHINKERR
jgi:glycosyltransferase involved in cell wall biosynthesis